MSKLLCRKESRRNCARFLEHLEFRKQKNVLLFCQQVIWYKKADPHPIYQQIENLNCLWRKRMKKTLESNLKSSENQKQKSTSYFLLLRNLVDAKASNDVLAIVDAKLKTKNDNNMKVQRSSVISYVKRTLRNQCQFGWYQDINNKLIWRLKKSPSNNFLLFTTYIHGRQQATIDAERCAPAKKSWDGKSKKKNFP